MGSYSPRIVWLFLLTVIAPSCSRKSDPAIAQKNDAIVSCSKRKAALVARCAQFATSADWRGYCEGETSATTVPGEKPEGPGGPGEFENPVGSPSIVPPGAEAPESDLPPFDHFTVSHRRSKYNKAVRLVDLRPYFDQYVGLCEADDRDAALTVLCEMSLEETYPCTPDAPEVFQ